MTTPTGQISMSQIRLEIYGSATGSISLTDPNVRTLAGDPTGAVSMDDCQGKTFGGGGGGATFNPSANGTYSDTETYPTNAFFTITCSSAATWTYSGGGSGGSVDHTSGSSSTSITFTLTASSTVDRAVSWTVTGVSGSVTRNYTISLHTFGLS
jgi:hypothetical protein